jgi:hypothetical protein
MSNLGPTAKRNREEIQVFFPKIVVGYPVTNSGIGWEGTKQRPRDKRRAASDRP